MRAYMRVPPANECGATNGDNEVWNLAPRPEQFAAIKAAMELREALRGYVQQLNNEIRMAPTIRSSTIQQSPKT